MDNMIEAKKDYYRQQQLGITKMGFTFKHSELPESVKDAELGHRFYIVFVDADIYDESNRDGEYFPNGTDTAKSYGIYEPVTRFVVDKREQTEGEKLRVRAVMLCKDSQFQEYISEFARLPNTWFEGTENGARGFICHECGIESRSKLTNDIHAQTRFRELLAKFDSWKLENQYADNLVRI